jgi:hypothetical protein
MEIKPQNLIHKPSKTCKECKKKLNFRPKKELKEKKTCIGPN